MALELPPEAVAAKAVLWDGQHLDLHGASVTVSSASAGGFTERVRPTARAFRTDWSAVIESLAVSAEGQADGMRTAIVDFLATDDGVRAAMRAGTYQDLLAGTVEVR